MTSIKLMESLKNISSGIFYQFLVVIFNFVLRTVFITALGVEYLGITSLYTNILNVVSISELGIGVSILYSMYEPLANNDEKKIVALINYYKQIYRGVAITIFFGGSICMIFLPQIVKQNNNIPNIRLYFFLYLLESISSYFYIYKASILIVSQKTYKINFYKSLFLICKNILQIFILIKCKNYLIYLIVQLIFGFYYNVCISKIAEKEYPYILKNGKLEKNEKRELWNNIKSMFAYKSGGIILNSTDDILISIIISLETVGLFSNYKMIINSLATFLSTIFIGLQARIGEINTNSDEKEKYNVFKELNMIAFWLYGIVTIYICILLPNFVLLWLGKNFVISNLPIYMYTITFYLSGILYPIWIFRETCGLFKYTKHIMYYASILNILLSVVFGRNWGLWGILFATVLSRLLTNIWFEPYKLYGLFFKKKFSKYIIMQFERVIIISSTIISCQLISFYLNTDFLILNLAIDFVVATIISLFLFYNYSKNKNEFKSILGKIKFLLYRLKKYTM